MAPPRGDIPDHVSLDWLPDEEPEPLTPEEVWNGYSKSARRAVRMLVAVNATFLRVRHMSSGWIRSIAFYALLVFYAIFNGRAKALVKDRLATMSLADLRSLWAVGLEPELQRLQRNNGSLAVNRSFDIPYDGSGGPISCRLYSASPLDETAPGVLFFIHGGGFVAMSPETHADICCKWTNTLNVPVVSIDYKLAPEYPLPYAHEECVAAFKWVRERGEAELGLHSTARMAVAGDSAGGQLSTTLALDLIDQDYPHPPDGLVLIYPGAWRKEPSSRSRCLYVNDYVLPQASMKVAQQSWRPGVDEDSFDYRLTPLCATDQLLAAFPDTYVVVAERDPLHDEGLELVRRLTEVSSNVVECKVYNGVPHGFVNMADLMPDARSAVKKVGTWLGAILELESHKPKFT